MVKTLTRYDGNRVDTLRALAQAGQRDSTAREQMKDRIADVNVNGRNSDYFQKGGWSSEGTVRINGVNYWCQRKYAPTTQYAQKTLEANKESEYLALTNDIKIGNKPASEVIRRIAKMDADKPAEQRRVLIPSRRETFTVASGDLGDVDIARNLARDAKLAQDYGKFLKNDCGINNVTFYQLSGDKNIAAGLWLCGLGGGGNSDFSGGSGGFNFSVGYSFGGRGRASVSDASCAQNSIGYSPKLVGKIILAELASRGLKISGFKESILEKLAKQNQ